MRTALDADDFLRREHRRREGPAAGGTSHTRGEVDRFVEPEYFVGSITGTLLANVVGLARRSAFGAVERDNAPALLPAAPRCVFEEPVHALVTSIEGLPLTREQLLDGLAGHG